MAVIRVIKFMFFAVVLISPQMLVTAGQWETPLPRGDDCDSEKNNAHVRHKRNDVILLSVISLITGNENGNVGVIFAYHLNRWGTREKQTMEFQVHLEVDLDPLSTTPCWNGHVN